MLPNHLFASLLCIWQVISALAAVSGKVDTLRAAQDSITAQVNALQAKVDQANLLAEARAANTQVQDLITGASGKEWPKPLPGVCCLLRLHKAAS